MSEPETIDAVDAAQLIDLGRAMARDVVHLGPQSGDAPVAAIFEGEDASPDDGEVPWIVIDLRAHPDPRARREAILVVHVDVGSGRGRAREIAGRTLRTHGDGTRLHARTVRELPSLDALFCEGPDAIAAWLETRGWKREWGMNGNFPDREIAREYERAWSGEHALYDRSGRAWAQLGGWPLTWPEQDYRAQRRAILVARTYRASEPWVEVMQQPDGRYGVRVRVT